jgi:hypothetical protein
VINFEIQTKYKTAKITASLTAFNGALELTVACRNYGCREIAGGV